MNNLQKYNKFISHFSPFEINEGLIKTQDPITVISTFHRLIRINKTKASIKYDDENRFCVECEDLDKNQADFILRLIGNYGYFVSEYKKENLIDEYKENDFINIIFGSENKINITFYIEPKYDLKIKIPDFLYHATKTEYLNNILTKGLFPKSKSKISYHPPRIYLSNTVGNAVSFARFVKFGHFKEMSILKIDTEKIKSEDPIIGSNRIDFEIYRDPNYKTKGYYTMNNIPPCAIEDTKIRV